MKAHGSPPVSQKMKTMRTMFKKGDFVRITESTHDQALPASRLGHILEEYKTIVHYTDQEKVSTGVWKVFMTNGVILRFHEMFLEHVENGTDRERKETD